MRVFRVFHVISIVLFVFLGVAFGMDDISLCDQVIKDAGIPIDGISGWPVERIDFKPEATRAQRDQAWQIVRSFDAEAERKKISDEKTAIEQKLSSLGITVEELRKIL